MNVLSRILNNALTTEEYFGQSYIVVLELYSTGTSDSVLY